MLQPEGPHHRPIRGGHLNVDFQPVKLKNLKYKAKIKPLFLCKVPSLSYFVIATEIRKFYLLRAELQLYALVETTAPENGLSNYRKQFIFT